jgi:hypothetical protein
MNNIKAELTFDQARALAYQEAKKVLTLFLANPSTPLFDDFFLEEDGSWTFFRNRSIAVPEYAISASSAYVVSRRGELRIFADFFDDLDKAKKSHKVVSDDFLANAL